MNIPIIGFAAYSGTGKTTLIEKLIPELKSRGYRLAVIKHDAHHFEIDKEGKDSWRFTHAGADVTLISSAEKTALIQQRECTFEQNLSLIRDVDLILVEGYKQEQIPKIGIYRKETGKGLPHPAKQYLAIATDDTDISVTHTPVFNLNDIEGIASFIIQTLQL